MVSTSSYDTVIVGASFAGLAAARHLGSNTLIIDRKPPGSGQASSCGAPLSTITRIGAIESVLQSHHTLVLHTARSSVSVPLIEPFCTFDFSSLIDHMATQVRATIVRANVNGLEGQEVQTSEGRFEGRVLIDASGWRASLASAIRPTFVDRRWLFCGLETEVDLRERGLHFWIEPMGASSILGWVFPCGSFSRIGVGSYIGEHPLGSVLDAFLDMLHVTGSTRHGGFFPSALREATVGHLFLVGDAAGQCFPLSGEGIRPALFFGDACGRIAREIIDERQSFLDGLRAYAALPRHHKLPFRCMRMLQDLLLKLPPSGQSVAARLIGSQPLSAALQRGYLNALSSPA